MSEGKIQQNREDRARELLRSIWNEVSQIRAPDLERAFVNENITNDIKRILHGRAKSFKYALLTQALAKAVDASLSCRALQARAEQGGFDARALCRNVVVRFEQENLSNALGGSSDPYVSKPLRRERISLDNETIKQIKHRDEWEALYRVIEAIETCPNPEEIARNVLKQVLLEVRKQISEAEVALPCKISAEQLRAILKQYLNRPSLGMGPQAVTYSLLKVFNRKTGTFGDMTSAAPTTADTAAGRVADIECRDREGVIRLAVCVTQRLDLRKLKDEILKCKKGGVANVLFVAYEIAGEVHEAYEEASRQGIDVTITELEDFALSMTVLLNGQMRRELVEEICGVLREWGGSSAEMEFKEVLRNVLRGI